MNDVTPTKLNGQLTLTIAAVVALCMYALFFKAFEVNNWPGFWLSAFHVAVVGLGTWLALRKDR